MDPSGDEAENIGASTENSDDNDVEKSTSTTTTNPSVETPIAQWSAENPPPASSMIAVKLLVSNNMAGSIIGRSGQTISDIQQKSSARVKLSQAMDYYPGTSDRVCLIQGRIGEVKKAVALILGKLHEVQLQQADLSGHRASASNTMDEEQDEEYNQEDDEQEGEKSAADSSKMLFTTRVLVSAAACGMLIGRAGANIKAMKEASGVSSIRLSARQTDTSPVHSHSLSPEAIAIATTSERVLTLASFDLQSCLKCTNLILNCMGTHPEICRYVNTTTSYSKVQASTAVNKGHRQMAPPITGTATNTNLIMNTSPQLQQHQLKQPPPQQLFASGTQPQADILQMDSLQQIHLTDQPPASTASRSGSFDAAGLITNQNPQTLSNSDIAPAAFSHQQQQRNAEVFSHQSSMYQKLPTSSVAGAVAHVTTQHTQQTAPIQLQGSHHATAPTGSSTSTTRRPRAQSQQFPNSIQIAIPDTKIGAILGKKGRTLDDLQSRSGARIKISQRGVFVRGTNDRVVVISGPTSESVEAAQNMIQQCIGRQTSSRTFSSDSNQSQDNDDGER